MKIPHEHLASISRFGYTETESRFIYIVATHSGYFTQRHYLSFIEQKPGWAVNTFIERLLKGAHVKQIQIQNNARVYQLSFKPLYKAIHKENIRNRRDHSLEFAKTRLAILDFVLANLKCDYLEGEQDKVQYFQENLKIQIHEMPGRTYKGSNESPDTIRHFVDKFPIFCDRNSDSTHPNVTFTYIDPGFENVKGFRLHLEAYSAFLKLLPCFAFIYACPSAKPFHAAERAFDDLIVPNRERQVALVTKYFRIRGACEAKRYELLSNADLEFLNRAKILYAGDGFDSAFGIWNAGHIATDALARKVQELLPDKRDVRFTTCRLPFNYSAFDQNSQVGRKPPGNRFSERFSDRFSEALTLKFR
jgi:hypothetical protein